MGGWMTKDEIERIDRITAAIHYLLKGKIPDFIRIESDPPDEIRQLSEKVNELIQNFKEIQEFIIPLSMGQLNVQMPRRNILASPFKQLQASLSHLTWQTKQIAQGDFNQRVDFMGDFSISFNAMVESLKEARTQLLSEAERYKKLAELKNHYLNVMAHDIRTPIGSVIGFSDILLENQLSDENKKYVQIIKRNCETLLSLINNILDMAKLENKKMEIDSVPFSIRSIGEYIGAMIEPKLNPGVSFVLEIDKNIPEKLLGDPLRLQQILINLVGNAAKFTSQGQITLKITVQHQHSNGFDLLFEVKDTGIGIPEDKQKTIFAPFTQADVGIASRFGGTGLGLAISNELVSLMGGKLQVSSVVGKGTCFYFTISFLPFQEEEIDKKDKHVSSLHRRSRILVVDDDKQALDIISHILSKQKIRFDLCQDSTKAYDMMVKAWESKDPFTLALIDIDMPHLNGYELGLKIMQDKRFKSVSLVAISAYMEKICDSKAPFCFSFVATKPISQQAMKRILDDTHPLTFTAPENECVLKGLKILVVDDNSLNRFLIRTVLHDTEVSITEAENGQEGVEKVFEQPYDVVLMDKMMPIMDGIEATKVIREKYASHELPILLFTADSSQEDSEILKKYDINGIIAKPIDYNKIVDSICGVLMT